MTREASILPLTEAALVTVFVTFLLSDDSPWRSTGILKEFDYNRGRTDVVLTTEQTIIAFEAKLKNWRRALDQAYRNTCFAEESYVLLPAEGAKRAMRYVAEFEARGVGICCIDDGRLDILHQSTTQSPIEPWITAHARELASV